MTWCATYVSTLACKAGGRMSKLAYLVIALFYLGLLAAGIYDSLIK